MKVNRHLTTHLVSQIVGKNFESETLRIGDLNGDGAPDLLFIQSVFATREITCLTAVTIHGRVLWQKGTPSRKNGRIYSDLPAQICDWDGDGRNEVLYVRQATYAELHPTDDYVRERAMRYEGHVAMIILDARTGKQKGELTLPAPADDCFLFADLTGQGRRRDFIVKDRYWNLWGVSHQGKTLWHWKGSTGHFPAIGDVDGDGRDEVFVGFALIDHDGKVLFQKNARNVHQDAAYMVRLKNGAWRLFFGNGGFHCLSVDGRERWHHPLAEAQHVVVGRFRFDSELQIAVINRGQMRGRARAPGALHLFDLNGREIWRREQGPGSWAACVIPIDWFGAGAPQCLLVYGRGAGKPVSIFDGGGNLVDALPPKGCRADFVHALSADVWGDSREEAILFGSRGAWIHANARPLALPTLYNETLYPGM
ncbi:MAG: hypothetical protein HY360_20660 [Verrucomicrobia bacterium]|nr:hypothetical protein [Verrucomicrobiota bacterium]